MTLLLYSAAVLLIAFWVWADYMAVRVEQEEKLSPVATADMYEDLED